MAAKYWPKRNAMDGEVTVSKHTCRIVGVVHNIVYRNPSWDSGDPVLYVAMLQDYQGWFSVVLRGRSSAYNLLPALQAAVASADSSLPITDVESLSDHIQFAYMGQKIPAEMVGVYGACCLLVAMLGVYAAMAYSVAQRSREFALRMALGSDRTRVLQLVIASSVRVALIGLAFGALGAFLAVRVLKSMLFGVSAFDPASATSAAAVMVLATLAAALLPALRAASIEPMQTLRAE
jgi:putative ABC transport system permease protein